MMLLIYARVYSLYPFAIHIYIYIYDNKWYQTTGDIFIIRSTSGKEYLFFINCKYTMLSLYSSKVTLHKLTGLFDLKKFWVYQEFGSTEH